jgi:hypothetical protein
MYTTSFINIMIILIINNIIIIYTIYTIIFDTETLIQPPSKPTNEHMLPYLNVSTLFSGTVRLIMPNSMKGFCPFFLSMYTGMGHG